MTASETPLSVANAALVAGRWAEARDGFEAALEVEENGTALFGLGLTMWWLRDPQAAIRFQERAYHAFLRDGDCEQAFVSAMYLCLGYDMTYGNNSASRGWLAKAARVVADHALDQFEGWVSLCRAVTEHNDDPVAAERWARQALETAGVTGDIDLDVCARSELGAVLVELGRLAEGAALLDEAMATALGGGIETLDSVVLASCRTIVACSRAADIRRATQWIRAAGDFNEQYGSPHLYTTCRVHHATVLYLTGQWVHAEAELNEVLRIGGLVEPALFADAVALLGTLRLAQGRIEDAERLIAGYEQHASVGAVLAGIRAAQGQLDVAVWLTRRRLAGLNPDGLDAGQALAGLVELEIVAGDHEAALADAHRLRSIASGRDLPLLKARSHYALGSALAAVDADADAATAEFERARSAFVELGVSYEAARARLALARHRQTSDRVAAVEEAKGALATFEAIGALPAADAALALLRALGVKAVRRGPNAVGTLTTREREVLALLGEGLSNREIATRLHITPKTVEHHVGHVLTKLDLRRRGEAAVYARRLPSAN
jgi:DNA-binding CsgD family transcriptional regulator